jgi:hypothetical protein
MAQKSLCEFFIPVVASVLTGPAINIDNKNFELRTRPIAMVQASPFSGLPSEDANAHLVHFPKLCDTIVIKDIAFKAIRLRLFPLSLVGKAKIVVLQGQGSCEHLGKCSAAFLMKFFPMGKTNALRGRITNFQQTSMEPILEA